LKRNELKSGLAIKLSASPRFGLLEALASGHPPNSKFWNLSIYSTGRTIRENIGLSRFKSLRLSSDHGLSWATKEIDAEKRIPSRAHLTWSFWRHHSQFSEEKRTIWVEHPWIEFRRRRGISAPSSPSGTVVFVSHSVPGITPALKEIGRLIEHVEGQNHFEAPYTYCLHMHDVNLDLHKVFLKRGRRVVTAGSSSSPFFIERLYSILAQHKNAVSFTPGTQVLIAQEFGLNSYISPLPNEPKLGRVDPAHRGEIDERLIDEFVEDFSRLSSSGLITEAKEKWLYLGLGTGSNKFDHLTGGKRPLSWPEVRKEVVDD
jgi:hypothetical protein